MPKIKKNDDSRLCWECGSYSIRVPGGPHCGHHKVYFPDATGWAFPDRPYEKGRSGIMPGLRTCKFWEEKEIKNET